MKNVGENSAIITNNFYNFIGIFEKDVGFYISAAFKIICEKCWRKFSHYFYNFLEVSNFYFNGLKKHITDNMLFFFQGWGSPAAKHLLKKSVEFSLFSTLRRKLLAPVHVINTKNTDSFESQSSLNEVFSGARSPRILKKKICHIITSWSWRLLLFFSIPLLVGITKCVKDNPPVGYLSSIPV